MRDQAITVSSHTVKKLMLITTFASDPEHLTVHALPGLFTNGSAASKAPPSPYPTQMPLTSSPLPTGERQGEGGRGFPNFSLSLVPFVFANNPG